MIKHLCAGGHRVEVFFDLGWSQGPSRKALEEALEKTPGLTDGYFPRRKDFWRPFIFSAREILSYSSYLSREGQSDFYLYRWEQYLPRLIQWAVKLRQFREFLATQQTQSCLRAFEKRVPPDATIIRWLKENHPEVVVASPVNMRFSEEVEYIKAAKEMGIPTVIPVLSWDNPTTKGLFHIIPDLILVWNQTQSEEVARIHRAPHEKILITGAPFFDKWFQPWQAVTSRESFCRKVGLDPAKPFVVYLGSSANVAQDETWLVRELVQHLRKSPSTEVRELQVLIRPHPSNARVHQRLSEEGILVWPRPPFEFEFAVPQTESAVKDFYCTLKYSLAALGLNTSGMIDAVVVDKPCIAILAERYNSTQLQSAHFKTLLDADVFEIVRSSEESVERITTLLKGVDPKRKNRRDFLHNFVRPRGLERPAGQVACQAIELVSAGKNGPEINLEIDRREMEMKGASLH